MIRVSFLFICLWAGIALSSKVSPELSLKLANGSPVLGRYMTTHGGHGIRAFKNIPYAEPPLGDLRFSAPVPKAPWTEPLPDSPFAIVCPQVDYFLFDGAYLGQEDCLYLNVYVPMTPKLKEPLPVMFFIHGGGFTSGTGDGLVYGPEFLLEEDVILVAGNYRLSALGFLATGTDEFPGNYGLKDQNLMLRWVQENIAQFGGDPNRVTIFGESAGAASVGYHMLSQRSKGLFHGAIMQSGNPFEVWADPTPTGPLKLAEKLFSAMGCAQTPVDYKATLICMREKSPEDIGEGLKQFVEWDVHPLVIFTPVKEVNPQNAFITDAEFKTNQIGASVPLMIGLTAQEGAFITAMTAGKREIIADLENRFDELLSINLMLSDRYDNETMKVKAQMVKDFYFNGEQFNWAKHERAVTELYSDNAFLRGFPKWMKGRIAVAPTTNTYLYQFNYRGATSFTDVFMRNVEGEKDFGVSHFDEILYLFPTVKNLFNFRIMNEEDHKMRKQMVKIWVHFATHGNPSSKNIKWTPVKQFPLDYMRIGNCNVDVCDVNTKLTSVMQTGFAEKQIEFVKRFHATVAPGAKEEL